MGEGAELVEQGLRRARVGWEVGLAYRRRLAAFRFLVAAMKGRNLNNGHDVGRGVVEGCAGGADGGAEEVDPSPVASKRGHQGVVLVRFLLELLVAAEVPANADLKEDEGAVLAVEEVDVPGRVGRHLSGVDDVGGSPRSGCHQVL